MGPGRSVAGDRRATPVLWIQELPQRNRGVSPTRCDRNAVRPPGLHCSPGETGAQRGVAKPGKAHLNKRWGGGGHDGPVKAASLERGEECLRRETK